MAKTTKSKKDIRIVVLQRGWVVLGEYSEKGDAVTLLNANVIRIWGTTKGLGQIALEGAQPNTKLDDCGTVKAHKGAVVFTIACTHSSFK